MKFILNLTTREIRSSWRRLLFFFLCIALGVGSIVALRSLVQNITAVVGSDARALMTGDLDVSSTNDFAPGDIAKIEETIERFPIVDGRNEVISTQSMVRPADPQNTALEFVDLRGIEPPFPLVGSFSLSNGEPFHFGLLKDRGVVIARVLLDELKIQVGDKVRIGEGEYLVRATFDEEPGRTGGFRLGSRVYIDKKEFDIAGITRNTSRVRRRIVYRTTENPTELVKALRDALKGTTIQVNSYREQQENLGDQFERTENYLSLTGLLILVLGGVGVWNVARAFVEQKRKSVAVLKCLGAGGTQVISVYLLQIFTLGVLGSLFGVLLAQGGLLLARWQFADALPAKMSYSVGFGTAAQGVALGVLISMLFSLLPLWQIRYIKPRLLLRDASNTSVTRLDRTRWLVAFGAIAAILALAVWQAGSIRVGAYFLGSLAATGLALYMAAALLIWSLRKTSGWGPFALRQSINSLYRPGNQTKIIILAVGLGGFVVLTVQIMQVNLVREFDLTRNQRLPSMVFVDIQRSQLDAVTRIIAERTGERPEQVPTVRARISHVNGEPIDFQQRDVRQQQGQIGREFAITYRPSLDMNETVISGEWWDSERAADVPEVSVDQSMADRLKVTPGDSITFDISGRKVTARVANIRKIDLRNTRTAFVFVFRPGTLDKAPQTFAATVLKHTAATDRQRLQRDVVDAFPNVQVFDVADIVATVTRLINNFVIAISFVGSFVLLTGILILIGSVALTRSQRIYENAIIKTLGGTRRVLTIILVGEYGTLGLLAGIISTTFSVAVSFLICAYMLGVEWQFDILTILIGIAAVAALVTVVGVATSFDVLFKKPLTTLRSQ
jgi:putative ABC transport system permease protein